MSRKESATDGGVVRLVDDVLARALASRASDVHFDPSDDHVRVRFRIDGILTDVDRLPRSLAENVVARFKVMAGLLTYRLDVPQEGSFSPDTGSLTDVRVATFPTFHGERAVVRLMQSIGEVSGLDDLGFDESLTQALRRAAEQPHGLILVSGPAGSGKSTTLYALARHILKATPGRSVVSLEDPVEQPIDGMVQIQVQPFGELNYVRAMRSLLRQDVEVLLVGEIRDAETAHVVIQAALTGHLIMSTMHSGDPAEAISRLLEMGVAPYQLAGAISVVCSQRLLRTICRSCRGEGCHACLGSGWHGRTACGQIAPLDPSLREAILHCAPVNELRRRIALRPPDLFADAQRVVDAGRTTLDEVPRVLGDPSAARIDRPLNGHSARLTGVIPCDGLNTKD